MVTEFPRGNNQQMGIKIQYIEATAPHLSEGKL